MIRIFLPLVRYYIMAVLAVPIGLAWKWDYAVDFYWHASPAEWVIAVYCFAVYLLLVPAFMCGVMELIGMNAEIFTDKIMKILKGKKK